MNTFTINEKEYKARPFDFELVCDLEDMGIEISEIGQKQLSFIRAYFGICAGLSKKEAGKQIEAHIANGGDFTELSNIISKEVEKSDFFHSLQKKTQTEITENKN